MKNIILKIKNALFSSDFEKEKQTVIEEVKITYKEQEGIDEEKIDEENKIKYGWDKVFYATFSNDLSRMLSVTELKTTLSNRHFLLLSIVSETYKLRKEEKYKNLCIKFSEIHLEEFPAIAKELKDEFDGSLPRVPTFQYYATLLTEIGEFEKAINVCKKAISFGLDDGTKGGYQGRIERITKMFSVK